MPDGRAKLIELTAGHRTKAEKELRAQAEKSLYTGERFTETKQVREDKIAHTEYLRLKRLFGKITFVDALDHQIINRYCMEISNQDHLQKLLCKMEDKLDNDDLEASDLVQITKSIAGVLSNINKSKELLLKYEDRLFLNPSGRIKSIPKTPEKKEDTGGIAAFLAKRNEV